MIRLSLPVPPSMNSYWRSITIQGQARVVLSSEARKYKRDVAEICRKLAIRPLDGPVALAFVWRCGPAGGDLDNRRKGLYDALKGIAYHDDGQIEADRGRRVRCIGHERPSMEVEIRQLEEGPLIGGATASSEGFA